MTILTKPCAEKPETLEVPLVNENDPKQIKSKKGGGFPYIEVPEPDFLISSGENYVGPEFASKGSLVALFLTALFLMGMGIVGGLLVYNQFARTQVHRMTGCCKVPYDGSKDAFFFVNSLTGECDTENTINAANAQNEQLGAIPRYFFEQFEIDPIYGNYERIDVPNFHNGRKGRFIHDFNVNKTGIIDLEGKRCFVMSLDESAVLPPRSLFDLVQKMASGYYDMNMTSVHQNMKVVLPPIEDYTSLGVYIAKDCITMPTYELRPFRGPIFKRLANYEADNSFAHFSGSNIQQLNIMNLGEVYKYEELFKNP